jgi:hypothetical protein
MRVSAFQESSKENESKLSRIKTWPFNGVIGCPWANLTGQS